ncbi:hypothetical protein KBW71_00315 [Hydrogenophaga aromaticivorans]|uniref:hypothetical protein n=1 Tax=Hydrogenophaga aromaticivorans TaxID=2610898 RepID=UPI001B397ED9|nr:hypothetical protein [Hydrogenophaga aromaticivorans]MBQ0916893.1 hypothetical protein [Hydrogenophaga aromaticivorans]MBU4337888.1 hypothetical protein [Actinomycetota bacterium]
MHTTQYGKHKLVSGLTWSLLDPFIGKHKQFQAWRQMEQGFGVEVALGGERCFGRGGEEVNGLISVAAMAARHPLLRKKTALLLLEIPSANPDHQSSVIVVGLKDGLVDLDTFVSEDRVPEIRSAFLSRLDGNATVYGDGDNLGSLDVGLTLEELLKRGRPSSARVAKLSSGRWLGIAAAIGALAIAAMGVTIWVSENEEVARRLEQERLDAERTPQVLYQQSMAAYLAEPAVSFYGAVALMRDQLATFPLFHEGWSLKRLNCGKAGCSVLWERFGLSGGTLDDFRSSAPSDWAGIMAVSQTEISHSISLQLPKFALDRQKWPTLSAWRERNVAHWQFIAPAGWTADISEPTLRAVPIELAGGPDEASLGSMPDAIRAVEVGMNGMPFWFTDQDPDSPMTEDLLGTQAVLDGDIQIDIDDKQITFSAKGLIHVQN